LTYCVGCGRPADECPGCKPDLDPARFCALCGRRLTVQVTPTHVTAKCRDHGMGFDQRIFGVFKRLHGPDIPGNGMGLAICNRIVLHYHGRIWVESEPGKGAKFVFTLPRRQRTEHG